MEFQEAKMTTLSDDIFDQLLGDVPESTVTQNNLLGSEPVVKVVPKNKEVTNDTTDKTNTSVTDTEEKEIIPQRTQEEIDADLDAALEEDSTNNSTDNTISDNTNSNDEIAHFFKAQYEGLVKSNLWEEIDENDLKDFEWTQENYIALAEQQAEWKAEAKYNEKVSASGNYGKAILDHIEKGGNPEDIIALFKEMKEIKDIDTTTIEGKIDLLHRYYVDELGWTEAKFKRNTDTWVDNGDIEDEVSFVNSKIEDSIKEKLQVQKAQAEQAKLQQEQAQINFANNVQKVLTDRKDITPKEQKEILDNLLRYDKVLPDGRKVNQFTLDFMKMQSDMNQYVDFVRYVKDPKKYNKTIETKVESETNKRNWNLIKGGAALNRTTSTKEVDRATTKETKGLQIDYRSILNNK